MLPALLALAVLVVAAFVVTVTGLSGPTETADRNLPPPGTAQNDAPLSIRWKVGAAQQYRVVSGSFMHMDNATSANQSITVQLDGLLGALTLEAVQGDALVGMRFSSLELKINDAVDVETGQALTAPFRVRFTTGGMPAAFEFPAAVSSRQREILENLVRMFQLSIEDADAWVATESNSNGAYEAAYRRSGPLQIEKIKRKFSAASGSVMSGYEITSKEQVHIDPAFDWVVAMSLDETLKPGAKGGQGFTVTNHAELALQRDARPSLTPDTFHFEAGAAAVDDSPVALAKQVPNISKEQARRQILSTIGELDALGKQGRIGLVDKLSQLMLVDESLPAVVLDALQTQQLTDRTRADLYLAFEEAGNTNAQAALVSVFTDNSTWSLRDSMRAIVALGGVDEPGPDSIAALWDTALASVADADSQRIASASAFALGTLGSTMNAADDPDYAALSSSLLGSALGGGDERQRSDFVFAVGNTQDASLAPEIAVLMADDSPSIRRATALSLGQLGVEQVADSLVSSYQAEDSAEVRSAIAQSLASWSQPSDSANAMFRSALKTETDEMARYNIVAFLGSNLGEFPENRAVLEEIMRTEPSARIRQKVAGLLAE
jgi:HEAT repeats